MGADKYLPTGTSMSTYLDVSIKILPSYLLHRCNDLILLNNSAKLIL